MPDYITGLAALCIPHTGRSKPFWQSLKNPDSTWTVAGRNYPDTSWFFGERELVDVSQYLAQAGLKTRSSMCASYERAVFDLLYVHIEQKGKSVPNVQASDIDDVVNALVCACRCLTVFPAGRFKVHNEKGWYTSQSMSPRLQ